MAKLPPEELEALARGHLDKEMAWIEELFGNVRAQSSRPSLDRLKVMRNLLIYRVTRISGFLEAHGVRL